MTPAYIVTVAPCWRNRALLTAQLAETCAERVISAVDAAGALDWVTFLKAPPAAIVIDAGQEITAEDVRDLQAALPDVPMIVIAIALWRPSFEPLRSQGVTLLVRPIRIGEIVQTTARVLAK